MPALPAQHPEQPALPDRESGTVSRSDLANRSTALLQRCRTVYEECLIGLECAHEAMARSWELEAASEDLMARLRGLALR